MAQIHVLQMSSSYTVYVQWQRWDENAGGLALQSQLHYL